jgi:hypothetical protein
MGRKLEVKSLGSWVLWELGVKSLESKGGGNWKLGFLERIDMLRLI